MKEKLFHCPERERESMRATRLIPMLFIYLTLSLYLIPVEAGGGEEAKDSLFYEGYRINILHEYIRLSFREDGSALINYEVRFYLYEESKPLKEIHLTLPGDFNIRDVRATLEDLRYLETQNLTVKGYSAVKPHGIVLSTGDRPLQPRSSGILRLSAPVKHLVHRSLNPFSGHDEIAIQLPVWAPDSVVGVSSLRVEVSLPFIAGTDEIEGHYSYLNHTQHETTAVFERPEANLNQQEKLTLTIPEGKIDGGIYPHSVGLSVLLLSFLLLTIAGMISVHAHDEEGETADYPSPETTLPLPVPSLSLSMLEASVALNYPSEIPAALMLISSLKKGRLRLISLSPLKLSGKGNSNEDEKMSGKREEMTEEAVNPIKKERTPMAVEEKAAEKQRTESGKSGPITRLFSDEKRMFDDPPFRPELLLKGESISRERVGLALAGIEKFIARKLKGADLPATGRLYRLSALRLQWKILQNVRKGETQRAEELIAQGIPLLLLSPSLNTFLQRLEDGEPASPDYLHPEDGDALNLQKTLDTFLSEVRKIIEPEYDDEKNEGAGKGEKRVVNEASEKEGALREVKRE